MSEAGLAILAQVVEQMGFLTPTGPGEGPQEGDIVIRIVYHGHASGAFLLAASPGLAEALARNLLAIDPPAPVALDDVVDALRELANVAAGNLLPQVLGDGEYRLLAPETGSWPTGMQGREMALECAEGRLAALFVEA